MKIEKIHIDKINPAAYNPRIDLQGAMLFLVETLQDSPTVFS